MRTGKLVSNLLARPKAAAPPYVPGSIGSLALAGFSFPGSENPEDLYDLTKLGVGEFRGHELLGVFPANVRWTFERLAAWRPQALVPG